MVSEATIEALGQFVPKENIFLKENMDQYTTFRIGGPAECFVEIERIEQLQKIQKFLGQIELPYFVLGNGSNLLVSDKGYNGIVLHIGSKMNGIVVEGNTIRAKAGALLSKVANVALEHSLKGMEFAAGIPGSVGGGVVMNAGAYGGEMSQVVSSVEVLDKEGNILELNNDTMEFAYRTSAIKNNPFIVTQVTFALEQGDQGQIQEKMKELSVKRKEKQPLEYPSAGSTFQRPEGHYAGELIMKAGLRGFQIGGAKVADKHCGFVINAGNACASDVWDLIREIQGTVKDKFNVDLEREVILLGEF